MKRRYLTKTKSHLTSIALSSALILAIVVFATAQEPTGTPQNQDAPGSGLWPCPMGHGMMCPGMMGQGMGPGAMQPLARDLEASDVKRMVNSWLAWQNNLNLKLGKIEAKDKYIIVAEIGTKDGSLVQSYEVNRQTGWMRPAQ